MRRPLRHAPKVARQAAEDARVQLDEVKAVTPRYRELAQRLVEIQRVNHLGAAAARVLRGDK
jgi:hypothetical protein